MGSPDRGRRFGPLLAALWLSMALLLSGCTMPAGLGEPAASAVSTISGSYTLETLPEYSGSHITDNQRLSVFGDGGHRADCQVAAQLRRIVNQDIQPGFDSGADNHRLQMQHLFDRIL